MKKKHCPREHLLRPYVRYLAYSQIFLQSLLPAALAISPAVKAAETPAVTYEHSLLIPSLTVPVATPPSVSSSNKKDSTDSMAQNVTSLAALAGSTNSAAAAQQYFIGQATQKATQEIETWLNQYGNARISINTNASDNFNMDGSSFDFLLPLVNQKNALTFMQFDTHYQDGDRLIGNVGVGQRFFFDSGWMMGANAFYDQDLTGNTSRAGLGLEVWTDNLKLSSNGYFAVSDWQNSDQLEGYDEKAANGFDVQVDGYLPAYPQLGGKLKYEKYYGDDVALFDTDHLQSNPSAVTVGINYTPVPLVTAGVDYKTGQDGMDETELKLDFNYMLGVPWSEQISADAVAIRRSLAGSRMDFVNRNNDIVMQYRKQDVIKLALPANLSGEVSTSQSLAATITSKYGVDRIDWDPASTLLTAGGKVAQVDLTHYMVTLPAIAGDYRLRGTAYDKKGNASNVAETIFNASQAATVTLDATPSNNIAADGSSYTQLTATVKDANGKPVTTPVTWATDKATSLFVDSQTSTDPTTGVATAKLTDTVAETVTVTVALPGGKSSQTKQVTFVATASNISLVAAPTSVPVNDANGSTLTATVTDKSGAPKSGVVVTFDKGSSQGVLSQTTATTGADGTAQVKLTDATAETVSVTASTTEQGVTVSSPSTAVTFTSAAVDSISLIASPTSVPVNDANGSTLTATVTDKSGAPKSGVEVTFDKGSSQGVLSQTTATTGADGKAQVTLTDATAETVTVTASTTEQGVKVSSSPASVIFTSVNSDQITLIAAPASVPVNDTNGSTLTATVTDSSGAPKSGVEVTFDKGSSQGVLSQTTATTGADGTAQVKLTDAIAETVSVTASTTEQGVKVSSSPASVIFTPAATLTVALSAPVSAYWTDGWTTDGQAASLIATVTDDQGSAVPDQTIELQADSGLTATAEAATDASGHSTIDVSSTTAKVSYNLKACISGTTMCSASVALPFYDPPKVKFGYLLGDQSLTSLPDARLQHGQFQLQATGGDGSYTWTSSASAVSVSGSGATATATLNDNVASTISVTTLGRSSGTTAADTLSYQVTKGSKMLYITPTFVGWDEASGGNGANLPMMADISAISSLWGKLENYTAFVGRTATGLPIWTNDVPYTAVGEDGVGSTYDPMYGTNMSNVDVHTAGEYPRNGMKGYIQ